MDYWASGKKSQGWICNAGELIMMGVIKFSKIIMFEGDLDGSIGVSCGEDAVERQ